MRKYIIGFIIGAMVMVSSNAFAAIGDSVTAVFAQFEYKVNGVTQTLDSPVLVYEGTSYLRTTDIANMLKFDVTYKADSRTIEFDNNAVTETTQPIPETTTPTTETTGGTELIEGEPTVTPTPDNTATCKAIRDDYGYQITMVGYSGLAQGPKMQKVLTLEHERDTKLTDAGC